jgi:DDE superfamily endonuclease/Tc5 transposase DNA-binding domain
LQNGNKTQADIAKEFSVDPATVWRVKQQGKQFKEKLAQTAGAVIQTKRIREGKFSEVDAKVFKWLRFMREKFSTTKLPVSSVMIKLQALNYARAMGLSQNEFVASNGWLHRFKNRYGLKNINLHGEMGDVDLAAIDEEIKKLRLKLAEFDLDCIFNMDETGLFFRCLPKRSYILKDESEKEVRGSKKMVDKNRVTLVVCCNATNSIKIPITMIGKPKQPECFKYIRACPVPYFDQSAAWMDAEKCQKWFDEVFVPNVRRFTQKKVALVWDNCPSHKILNNHADIEIILLPKNCTSRYQPLDQGILRALKCIYKKQLTLTLLELVDSWDEKRARGSKKRRGCAGLAYGYPAHLLDAAELVYDLWKNFAAETIVNCFLKSEILPPDHHTDLIARSAKYRRAHHFPELPTEAARVVEEVDEEETVGDMIRAMHRLRQIAVTPGNHSTVPEIAQHNIFFQIFDEHASISESDARQAISRWIGIEDEPEIMAEIVEAEFESKEATLPNTRTSDQMEMESVEDSTSEQVEMQSAPAAASKTTSKSQALSAISILHNFCAERKMNESLKLLEQFERTFTKENSSSAKQLSLFDMFKK